jgi:hypothetical protein
MLTKALQATAMLSHSAWTVELKTPAAMQGDTHSSDSEHAQKPFTASLAASTCTRPVLRAFFFLLLFFSSAHA